MSVIAERLSDLLQLGEERRPDVNNVVFMAFLCMVGEAMVGDSVRRRFRPDSPVASREAFRNWLIPALGKLLRT